MENDKQQLHLDLGIPLEPPKEATEKPKEEQTNQIVQLTPTIDSFLLPSSLQASAQSSISLRSLQENVAKIITNENYLALIAGTNPEVLPELLNSITNAVSTSDNLMIQMAKISEKSAAMNRIFEYMTKQKEDTTTAKQTVDKNEFYDESVEKIKKAIYKKLDEERNAEQRTAQDYIDAEYTEVGEEQND